MSMRGESESFAIEANAEAEAEQMAKKADAFKEYKDAAMVDKFLETLPKENDVPSSTGFTFTPYVIYLSKCIVSPKEEEKEEHGSPDKWESIEAFLHERSALNTGVDTSAMPPPLSPDLYARGATKYPSDAADFYSRRPPAPSMDLGRDTSAMPPPLSPDLYARGATKYPSDATDFYSRRPPAPSMDLGSSSAYEEICGKQIRGKTLAQRMKNMTNTQKRLILQKIENNKSNKNKYFENKRLENKYKMKMEALKQKSEELEKEIQFRREDMKMKTEALNKAENGIEDTEEQLQNFKMELKRRLKINNEKEQLESQIEKVKREIRVKSKIAYKNQGKLLRKAEVEKEMKEDFQKSIGAIKKVSKKLAKNHLLSAVQQKELHDSIVQWTMQLALYEDSNLEEIYALHDGRTRGFEQ